jgi:hypothetical protein
VCGGSLGRSSRGGGVKIELRKNKNIYKEYMVHKNKRGGVP